MNSKPSDRERLEHAVWVVSCVDTVTLMTCEEVESVRARALAGEFDEWIRSRSVGEEELNLVDAVAGDPDAGVGPEA